MRLSDYEDDTDAIDMLLRSEQHLLHSESQYSFSLSEES
jgi:hypothetical protein